MESTLISGKGQIQIPALLRQELKLEVGQRIAWTQKNGVLIGIPEPLDAITALFGSLKGTNMLLAENLKASRIEERNKVREQSASSL